MSFINYSVPSLSIRSLMKYITNSLVVAGVVTSSEFLQNSTTSLSVLNLPYQSSTCSLNFECSAEYPAGTSGSYPDQPTVFKAQPHCPFYNRSK